MHKMKKKRLLSFVLGCCLALMMTTASFAATKEPETRNPINSVTLNVSAYVRDGDESGYIMATGTSGEYSVGNYDWGTAKTWKIGDVPKVKIYLHARDNYYFNKTSGKGKVIVNGATFKSAKIKDNKETLVVTVELEPVSGDLEDADEARWVGDPVGKATWDPVEYAEAYELTLFRDGQRVTNVEKVIGTTYDFFPYMTTSGKYEFRVRAVPKDSEEKKYMTESDWTYSDEQRVDSEETPGYRYDWNVSAQSRIDQPIYGWQKDGEGWWFAMNGGYISNQWAALNGKWYLFDNNGYMLTGWQNWNGAWYYLSVNGDMQTGWLQDNRQWYYLGENGAAVMGWNQIDGDTYFMNGQCAAVTGWWLLDGNWYYFEPTHGKMVRNAWIDNHYVGSDGIWHPPY